MSLPHACDESCRPQSFHRFSAPHKGLLLLQPMTRFRLYFLQPYTTQLSLSLPSKEFMYWISAYPSTFSLGCRVTVNSSLRYLLDLRLLLEGDLFSGDSVIKARLLIIVFRKTSQTMSLRNTDVKIMQVNHIRHATSVMLR